MSDLGSLAPILGLLALLTLVGSVAFLFFLLKPRSPTSNLQGMMGRANTAAARTRTQATGDSGDEMLKRLREQKRTKAAAKAVPTLDELMFRAGIVTDGDRKQFQLLRGLSPVVAIVVALGGCLSFGVDVTMTFGITVLAGLVGYRVPFMMLDSKIKARSEDIMYYLPLFVEQVVIGVSSSLDIGPCLQRVVAMADERDSHNVVTELVKFSQQYMRSGVSLEEAMTEVGRLAGHTELKHVFISISQVAKHGGEVTRQLQELADAVSAQREAKIEEIIKKLELKATGPVGLVFFGFMIILLTGFGIQLMKAF